MRLGQARLFVEEGASADLGRFQRTLKENDAAQPIARGVDQQGGVMLRLCGPKAIELMLQMAALGIEIIAFAAERQPHALCFAACQRSEERRVGKSVSLRVTLGGRPHYKKKK